MPTPSPLIELRALRKVYREGTRERVILDDVDTTFVRGELVVLLGRSGSGKSTLLNLLGGIDPPTAGEVIIEGRSLTAMTERDRTLFRREHIGLVFQAMNLVPTLTVVENVLLPLELNGHPPKPARDRALAVLAEVGLADRADSFPELLSGGEQQRVAIARALGHEPLLILADEPTGNLDLETARGVLDLLDRLSRAAGKTLIMATHSPEVVGIADRILSVREGRLIEHDRAEIP